MSVISASKQPDFCSDWKSATSLFYSAFNELLFGLIDGEVFRHNRGHGFKSQLFVSLIVQLNSQCFCSTSLPLTNTSRLVQSTFSSHCQLCSKRHCWWTLTTFSSEIWGILGIKPGTAGSGNKNTKHGTMLPSSIVNVSFELLINFLPPWRHQ